MLGRCGSHVRSLALLANQAEELHRPGTGGPEPVRGAGVELGRLTRADGRLVEVDAAVVTTRMVARTGPFAGIGVTTTPHPGGEFVEADDVGRTTVPGVWAAGNVCDLSAQVSGAAAQGARAAQAIIADLMTDDLERRRRIPA